MGRSPYTDIRQLTLIYCYLLIIDIKKTMSEFKETIEISAAQEHVWEVLADIGAICEWNPGVKDSKQTSPGDVSVGATRHCDLGGRNYLDEEVVEFAPDSHITIRITDTNLPFKSADIRFSLVSAGANTLVTVSPDYQLKYGLIGRILDTLVVRSQYRKGMQGLLQGLKARVESNGAS